LSKDAGVIEEFLYVTGCVPSVHHFQSERVDRPVFADALNWRELKHRGDADAVILYRSFQNVSELRDGSATYAGSEASFV
jgi:hypothetical protein